MPCLKSFKKHTLLQANIHFVQLSQKSYLIKIEFLYKANIVKHKNGLNLRS